MLDLPGRKFGLAWEKVSPSPCKTLGWEHTTPFPARLPLGGHRTPVENTEGLAPAKPPSLSQLLQAYFDYTIQIYQYFISKTQAASPRTSFRCRPRQSPVARGSTRAAQHRACHAVPVVCLRAARSTESGAHGYFLA